MSSLILRGSSIAWKASVLAGATAWAVRGAVADTLFFTNEADWVAATTNRELFQTTAANVGLADEVDAPAQNNVDVGSNLTFQAVNTGLPWSFRVATLQAGARFTFSDNEEGAGYPPYLGFEEALSVGDIDDYEDDDFEVVILDGPNLHGVAMDIGENDPLIADGGVYVYDPAAQLIGYSSIVPARSNAFAFLGIVSDAAIGRVVIDEDTGGDDVSVRHFRFARHRTADPAVTAWAPLAGGQARLEWPSASDWRYDVEACADLVGEFAPFATNLPATPPVNGLTNILGPGRAFFRVRARAEP
ncbi:MAG TPA: hypothetical protein P5567_13725 [Kiritimatiellia bacterium]|nr:hypothetical protein [Kiritimatiellia bacterium]HRZ13501.1 hypothetical protein [Kiritimatiellia bacterium]HSA19194.1 hypothetical protein [Kiritimatiellia bacterium]